MNRRTRRRRGRKGRGKIVFMQAYYLFNALPSFSPPPTPPLALRNKAPPFKLLRFEIVNLI
jgi:hypothetical protein